MAGGPASSAVEAEALERSLKALSFANRIELLAQLRTPKTLDELRLTPSASHAGSRPQRPLTRQAVRHHLDKLAEVGLVRLGKRKGEDGRTRTEYVLDEARLYGIIQQLEALASEGTGVSLEPFETEVVGSALTEPLEAGPKLVLVRGARQDGVFELDPGRLTGERGWVIGRSADVQIPLPYDPYISSENSEIIREDDGYAVIDLRTSTNGTVLNGQRLPVGDQRPLAHGDILQVGCSMLVFHER